MKSYNTVESRIQEKKKRVYENAVKARKFGKLKIDYDILDKIWKMKSFNILSGSVK